MAQASAIANDDHARRLAAVEQLGALDRLGDPVLTALTRLAAHVTGAASAAVHIFDEQYQRRVAAVGAPLLDHPASDSLCRAVIEQGTRVVVCDASDEERFAYSSFVHGEQPPVRFYASHPLQVNGDVAVGTLCAFDSERLELSDAQDAALELIADLARAHLELVRIASDLGQAATLDPLTGAVNRVIFHDRLAQALARRRRRQTNVLVALIDVQDFKQYNDTHGHGLGDGALRWVVKQLHAELRAEDTVGRLGGDEFAVIAELNAEAREAVTERICRASAGFAPAFSVTVGTTLARDGDDVATVLRRADAAMYRAKPRRSPGVR